MKDPYIILNGITVYEPMTAFTDLIICAISLLFYFRIKTNCKDDAFGKSWSLFFFWMFTSTLIGTIAHGAHYYFPETTFKVIWLAMNLSGLIATFYSIKATISFAAYSNSTNERIKFILPALMALFVILTIALNNFIFVKVFAGVGLLYIFFTHFKPFKNGRLGSGSILLGIGISFLTVFIHTAKISFHEHFNFKDISHVIMMLSLYFIFSGVMLQYKEKDIL